MARPSHPEPPEAPWRSGLRSVALLLVIAGAFATTSCRTTIVPPPAPAHPVVVHLLDHGRHASLVLPAADGSLVRYSYGDWRFYALAEDTLGNGAAALLWPTRACFGRREIGPLSPHGDLQQQLEWRSGVGIEAAYAIVVDRCAAAALQQELDDLFESQRDRLHWQPAYNLEFVPHPRSYHLFHNSNSMAAAWLRQLGCEVRGGAILSVWRVDAGGAPP